MIGFLSGVICSLTPPIVNVNGVGYKVTVPTNLKLNLNSSINLYIHTHVREDTLALYGFSDSVQLNLFETLLSVSGIGPKIALTLLSSASPEAISSAISTGNVSFFTAIPGVGKRGAQRLIVELKPKLGSDDLDLNSFDTNSELTQALSNLGFKAMEIKTVINKANVTDPIETQLKVALSFLRP